VNAVVEYDPIAAMGIITWQDGMRIEPGNLYLNMPNELYHKGPGISKSGLDLIHRSPMHYKFYKENPKPPTDALFFGSALHTLVLEGEEKFLSEYTRFDMTRQSKEGKAVYQGIIDSGKTPISGRMGTGGNPVWDASDWDTLFRMRDSVMKHYDASFFLGTGIPELAGYWVDTEKSIDELDKENDFIRTAHGKEFVGEEATYKLCKMKMDWYNHDLNFQVDLKSTTDASYTAFGRSVVDYRYYVQDAYYRHGMRYIGWPVDEFIFIAVEKEPPYGVAGYVLDSDAKQLGRSQFRRDLATYLECKKMDFWPGYQDPDGKVTRDLILPQYALHHQRIF
jgi:exodeoxyribonuclease VIII